MRVFYAIEGTIVAEVVAPTHIPREGEQVFLKLEKASEEQLFKIVKVAWGTAAVEGEPGQYSETNVYILVEPPSKTKQG